MELTSNLTLELSDQPFLLEKRIELLKAIKNYGSISKAAKAVPMSYKAAWDAVDTMNNLSHTPIVSRETGGKGGGGTTLTEYGENLLRTYTVLKEEQKRFLERLKLVTDVDKGTLKTIGRLSMQISARNQLSGRIEKIVKGKVNSQLFLQLKSGNTLISVITNDAVETLGLKEGDDVTAIFKSTSVLLGTGEMLISAENRFEGIVETVREGTVNAEVVIKIGELDRIVAVLTKDSVEQLGIESGCKVFTLIKSADIMIGK
ncbi:TOBE domain-containing protein [Sulfurovum sp. zt1-1]|uniref:TOBE domain-containing protein n=1 Tax=Sulfurovum zhangzhouensis TaxID=3019067 RepID=A0ABT7QV83_9BACT|nr:TOBE domain-containing protein [Sulfurovum zhangzhouensis]MDM5270747.1 TOBE domain-containing protein [Sulfurovum zhangzhouensis]